MKTSLALLSKQADGMYGPAAHTALKTAEPAFKNLAKWAKTAISNEPVIALPDQNQSKLL